jgi:hypothetical protein
LTLVEAVCVAENIQRPSWFRKIEYLLPSGSYGIMQVKSKKKLNDMESIKIGIKKYFNQTNVDMDRSKFEDLVLNYNNSQEYVELVHRIMIEIDSKYCNEFNK